jgi:hypothetical protein
MATMRHLQGDRQQKSSPFRSWLRNALWFGIGAAGVADCADVEQSAPPAGDASGGQHKVAEHDCGALNGSVVLPFPIRGEALLVRLAGLLRHRVGNFEPMHDPFLFAVSRQPGTWLAIDHRSSVEFISSRSEFRFEVEVAPNTNIVIRTGDFESLVEFVVQYVSV